jgi:UDP-glucose 4-epimerase
MVVPRFVAQALAGEPLTVFGTGQQVRCFCHVSDVVAVLPALADMASTPTGVVNLGSTEMVSIMQLARRVIAVTGSDSPVVRVPYETAYGLGYEDLERRVPDCSQARQLVGFEPAYSLDDIIRSVVADQTRGRPRLAASV